MVALWLCSCQAVVRRSLSSHHAGAVIRQSSGSRQTSGNRQAVTRLTTNCQKFVRFVIYWAPNETKRLFQSWCFFSDVFSCRLWAVISFKAAFQISMIFSKFLIFESWFEKKIIPPPVCGSNLSEEISDISKSNMIILVTRAMIWLLKILEIINNSNYTCIHPSGEFQDCRISFENQIIYIN